jgi:hypothetical protein
MEFEGLFVLSSTPKPAIRFVVASTSQVRKRHSQPEHSDAFDGPKDGRHLQAMRKVAAIAQLREFIERLRAIETKLDRPQE